MSVESQNSAPAASAEAQDFDRRARENQRHLAANLTAVYDFIVCGAGSSGSVVARRLAENPAVRVLLLEAGGSDEMPAVFDPLQWPTNLGSARDWGFQAAPNPHLNNRAMPLSMGKVLGGGSSINVLAWVRGHREDWEHFAAEAGDEAWNYQSVLNLYRRIEDWQGAPDAAYRGTGGPVTVQPAQQLSPVIPALLAAAVASGIPQVPSINGALMEGGNGCAPTDMIVKDGRRQSIYRAYVHPVLDQPNLTVITGALVTRLTFAGRQATGVEVLLDGQLRHFAASREVVLSLGALQTPKLLLQSGIGDEAELRKFGIPLVQHLPGVGQNMQDHVGFTNVYEMNLLLPPRNNIGEALLFWHSNPALASPDILAFMASAPLASAENLARYAPPVNCYTLFYGLCQPKSRGRLWLTGARPTDPLRIEANTLSHPADLETALAGMRLCRELGNAAPLQSFAKRELMPGPLSEAALDNYLRDAASTYWHQTCTAKMGQDELSVVDGQLRVYGVKNLRIADGSIMPRVTTGNTMAPCVVIGERAGDLLKATHGL
jgi:choline dehydrogenase